MNTLNEHRGRLRDLFVGRRDELSELCKAWSEGRHVAVSGPSGVGKTALLKETLRLFPPADRKVIYCEKTSTLREMLAGLVSGLNVGADGLDDVDGATVGRLADRLSQAMSGHRVCVILDHIAPFTPKMQQVMNWLVEHALITVVVPSLLCKNVGHLFEIIHTFQEISLKPFAPPLSQELLKLCQQALAVNPPWGAETQREIVKAARGLPGKIKEICARASLPKYRLGQQPNLRLILLDMEIEEGVSSNVELA